MCSRKRVRVTDFGRARPNAHDHSWNCRRCFLRSRESDLVPATSRGRDPGRAAEMYEDSLRASLTRALGTMDHCQTNLRPSAWLQRTDIQLAVRTVPLPDPTRHPGTTPSRCRDRASVPL